MSYSVASFERNIILVADRALLLAEESLAILTEVTESGEIAWELTIPGGNNTYYWYTELRDSMNRQN